jgi:hypothetical protein
VTTEPQNNITTSNTLTRFRSLAALSPSHQTPSLLRKETIGKIVCRLR